MGNLDDITVAENLRQDKSAPSSPTKSQQQQQVTTANTNTVDNSFDQSTSNVEFSLSQFEMKKTVGKGAFGHVSTVYIIYNTCIVLYGELPAYIPLYTLILYRIIIYVYINHIYTIPYYTHIHSHMHPSIHIYRLRSASINQHLNCTL